MNAPANPNLFRRDLLRAFAAGAAAAAGAPIAVAATRGTNADKAKRAAYQPNSPDVQNFYRVNRYPPKR
jgi:hypothetical protein